MDISKLTTLLSQTITTIVFLFVQKKKEKGEKKEKIAKKDKKETKTPKTPRTPKKDKKEKEEIKAEASETGPQPVAEADQESQPAPETEPVVKKPQKSSTLVYLESLQAFLEKLFEYQWPQDPTGDYYLLEHQLNDFLGVSSLYDKHHGGWYCSN